MSQTTIVSEFAPRVRKDFSKIPRVIEIPNLLEIQKDEKSGGYIILSFGPNA